MYDGVQPEVGEHDSTARGEQHVLGLDVAVRDPGTMNGGQAVGDGDEDVEPLLERQARALAPLEVVREGHAVMTDGRGRAHRRPDPSRRGR